MIELNKTYSTTELIEALEISLRTWQRNKDEILEFLKNYFIYYSEPSQQDKRKINYVFTAQLEEFPGYSKSAVLKEEKIKFFQNLILETVEKNNIQTAANVARTIYDKVQEKHKLQLSTVTIYVSEIMRKMFGRFQQGELMEYGTHGFIEKKVWVIKDPDSQHYIRLAQRELDELYRFLRGDEDEEEKEKIKRLAEKLDNDEITISQFKELVGEPAAIDFLQARLEFAANHDGQFPIKASMYVIDLGIQSHETLLSIKEGTFDL